MPTIVFVSPKGGAGKTTASLLLAARLAESYDVTVIDADPNRPIKAWASGGNAPRRLSIISDVDEDNIIATIKEAPNVEIDLSPDGQIKLAQNGVKGKVLAAMRERSHKANQTKTASP